MSFNTVTQKVGAFAHDRERERERTSHYTQSYKKCPTTYNLKEYTSETKKMLWI